MRACSQIPECSLSYTKIIIKWNIVKSLRNSFPFFQYIYRNYRCGISTRPYRGGSNSDVHSPVHREPKPIYTYRLKNMRCRLK